jgi:predicted transcriptional regulator
LDQPTPNTDALSQTSTIVAAFVAKNSVPVAELPSLINSVYASLTALGTGTSAGINLPAEPLKPAVPIRRSITPEFLICLEDGKKLKMLKRHLASTYNMTPDEYRAKWGLSHDYPMVAPKYSSQRSELAKKLGLGTQPRVVASEPAPARRGRRPAQAAA